MDSVDPMLIAFLPKDVREMFFPYASVQLGALVLNLLVGFALAMVIAKHFRKYASAFCNRQDFSRLFPLLMLTVILIITVVKASLALALGLVGALSIVRFRTPIKEPEELLYLFLNIGVAVALGAGQTLAAIVACFMALALVTWVKKPASAEEKGLFLSLFYEHSQTNTELTLDALKTTLSACTVDVELRRFEQTDKHTNANFFIRCDNSKYIDKLFKSIRGAYPGAELSLIEQHNISGV